MEKGMSQPPFILVLSTEKKKFSKCVIYYIHYLKSILSDDSFKEYFNPMVSINLCYNKKGLIKI